MTLTNRRALTMEEARVLWKAAAVDERARAPVGMQLLAGLRPREVAAARWDGALLRVAGRRIRPGPTCTAALDHVTDTHKVITGPLLPHFTVVPLVLLVRSVGHAAGLDVGAPDLRHAAIRAAFDAGLPREWICQFFGTAPARGRLPNGWDTAVAGAIEEAFT